MQELRGKTAVITGGASGIGLAMARRFGAEGMRLVLGDIEEEALLAAAEELRGAGVEVEAVVCDVSREDDVADLAGSADEAFGATHLVCLNAGVGGGGPMQSLTTRDWEWVLGVNLWGVIHGITAFLPRLLEQGQGHIVNTASMAGLIAPPFMGPYDASKFAVVAISEALHHEMQLAGGAVGVSVLCPSWVSTRIHESHRNRPEHLLPEDGDGGVAGQLGDVLAGVIESGMDPAAVADLVHDAVVGDRFYILTHDDSRSAVEARMQAILDGAPPPFTMPQ